MNTRQILAGLTVVAFGCTVLAAAPRAEAADQKKEPEKVRAPARPLAKPPVKRVSQPAARDVQRKTPDKRDTFIDRDANGVDDRKQRKVVRPESSNKPPRTTRPSTIKPRRQDPRSQPSTIKPRRQDPRSQPSTIKPRRQDPRKQPKPQAKPPR